MADLTHGHLAALGARQERAGVLAVNLGTGRSNSVQEMVRAFAAASGVPIPYRVVARRQGYRQCYADPSLPRVTLGWQAQFGIDARCGDTRCWQRWAAENLS